MPGQSETSSLSGSASGGGSGAGGLFRGLAVPFAAFVLAASIGVTLWFENWHRRESLAQFARTAAANAEIVDRLRLPRSPELAEKLSAVLGAGVGFAFPDATTEGLPPELDGVVPEMLGDLPVSRRVGSREVATAPLPDGRAHLVLVRDSAGIFHADGWSWLWPPLMVSALGGGLAFLVARRIVRPLRTLMKWLPNLDREKSVPVAAKVTARADEIGALARSLEATHRRALDERERRRRSERLAALGRIATGLAHEIKNPAAAIRLHADLLASRAGLGKDADTDESIGLIRDEVGRITDLVNQWLFVARPAPARRERRDLAKLLGEVARRLAPRFEHAGVSLKLDGAASAWIEADGPRVEQALLNLMLNAAQAMPEGGEIRASLAVGEQTGTVSLTIADAGPGFSPGALKRWREPFFSEREGGMGLGLTLADEVTRAHGGELTIENSASGGAIVRWVFPAYETGETRTL